MNEHKDLIKKAFFGDANSKKELMLIADELLAQGKFEDAANLYKEAASCYRMGESRAEGGSEEVIELNQALQGEIKVLVKWIATHPSGFATLPVASALVTGDAIWNSIFGRGSRLDDRDHILATLETAIKEAGASVGSQGNSVNRRSLGLLERYFFGPIKGDESELLSNLRVRIAVDLLADHVMANVASGIRTDGRDFS